MIAVPDFIAIIKLKELPTFEIELHPSEVALIVHFGIFIKLL